MSEPPATGLAEIQRRLAASLGKGAEPPAGIDPRRLERARQALAAKRRRAAEALLPRLRKALGDVFAARFASHFESYTPAGRLHHVDDAWAFAESLAGEEASIARAARDDRLALRLSYVRHPRREAGRIRERRSPLVALTALPPRFLVVRTPGFAGRVWRFRWPLPFGKS